MLLVRLSSIRQSMTPCMHCIDSRILQNVTLAPLDRALPNHDNRSCRHKGVAAEEEPSRTGLPPHTARATVHRLLPGGVRVARPAQETRSAHGICVYRIRVWVAWALLVLLGFYPALKGNRPRAPTLRKQITRN